MGTPYLFGSWMMHRARGERTKQFQGVLTEVGLEQFLPRELED